MVERERRVGIWCGEESSLCGEGALLGEGRDKWGWRPEGGRAFSVNSCCKLLERLFLIEDHLSQVEECGFGGLWNCRAPSKVLALAWTLLLDRIPTRVNLAIMGVLKHWSFACFVGGWRKQAPSKMLAFAWTLFTLNYK